MQSSGAQCKCQGHELDYFLLSCSEGYPFYRFHVREQVEAGHHKYRLGR